MRRTVRSHPRHRVALAALSMVAGPLAALSWVLPAQPAQAATKPTAVVAMGDSFTSGEAGRWAGNSNDDCGDREGTDKAAVAVSGCSASYYRELTYLHPSITNGCHRSKTAPILSAAASVDKRINLACSGAKSQHIWRASRGGTSWRGEAPQADQLAQLAPTHDIKAIFLGVGGNDIGSGFGDVVGECIEDYLTSGGIFEWMENHCRDDTRTAFEPDLATVQARVLKSLQEVRDTMRTAGVADSSYRLILVGYPSILPGSAQIRFGERNREYSAACPFWDEDLDYFDTTFMPKLAANLRATAAVANSVEFLDLGEAFNGHRLCEDGTTRGAPDPATSEWVRFFDLDIDFAGFTWPPVEQVGDQGDFNEQFHPNQFGQQAIGMCYTRVLANKPLVPSAQRRCKNGPTRQPSDMVLAAVPTPPAVVDVTTRSIPSQGSLTVNLTVPEGYGRPAETVQVGLDITHPHRGELRVTLIDPAGKTYVLHSPSSATGPNVYFDKNVPFIPANPAGVWKLKIEDLVAGSAGTLNRWGLEFF